MTSFIVFAGPNGSGKSTVRDSIDNPVEVVIDPDRIAREINPANPRRVDQAAGREAVRRFEAAINDGLSVSMETTLTGHTAVQRLRRAKDSGYDVSLIYVALGDPETNVARVAARVRKGGHHIDPEIVRRRVQASLGNLPAALTIADQALVLDNSGPIHRRILEASGQRVTFLADQLPHWLEAAMPTIVSGLRPTDTELAISRRALAGIFDAIRSLTPVSPSISERLASYRRIAAEQDPDWRPSKGLPRSE